MWSRNEKIAFATLTVAIGAIVVQFLTPEFRSFAGLSTHPEVHSRVEIKPSDKADFEKPQQSPQTPDKETAKTPPERVSNRNTKEQDINERLYASVLQELRLQRLKAKEVQSPSPQSGNRAASQGNVDGRGANLSSTARPAHGSAPAAPGSLAVDLDKKAASTADPSRSGLEGMTWREPGASIEGKDVFLEFLDGGSVRTRAGYDGNTFVFANESWYRAGSQIFVEIFGGANKRGVIYMKEGNLKGDRIVGSQRNLETGSVFPWTLVKVNGP